jgi:V/A-type H+-transporting ATPase subunit C
METAWRYGDDVRYAYAVGRIRAMETKLLTEERIDRMADAGGIDDLMRLLGETQYADSFSRPGSARKYEAILENEMGKILKIVLELSKDPALTGLFQLLHDFHNLKVALKENYGTELLDSAYITLGIIPIERLRESVRKDERIADIPAPIRTALKAVRGTYPKTPDPSLIDILVDRAMFQTFLEVAIRERCLFLYELLKQEIDLINILSFFRIRWEDGNKAFFHESFLEGGTLSRDFMSNIFEDNLNAVPSRFSHTPYGQMVTEGLTYLQTQGSFLVFEKMKEEFLCTFIRRADLIAFGIEPLIAYLYKRESELRSIRIIFGGLLNNVPPQKVKERISRGFF